MNSMCSLGRHRGRGPAVATWLSVLVAAGASGCRVHHPESYLTPLDAVLSFQTAYAHDDVEGEYRALAPALKEQVPRLGWPAARARMLAHLGCIGRFVLRRNSLHDNLRAEVRHGPSARLWFAVGGRRFQVTLDAVPWMEVQAAGGGREAAVPSPPGLRRVLREERPYLVAVVELPRAFVDLLERSAVAEVSVGTRWKIAGFDTGDGVPDGEPAPPPPRERRFRVDAIAFEVGREVLGYRTVEFHLPAADLARAGDALPLWSERLVWQALLE